MKLAHACDDGLTRFFISVALEGRILFGELCKRDSHLLLACLGLGLDSDPDNGIGELHGLKDYRSLGVAERVAGGGVLKTDSRSDISGVNAVDILSVVGVHLQDSSQTLVAVLGSIVNSAAGGDCARINSEEAELTDEGIGRDLESKSCERLGIRRMTELLFTGLGVRALYRRDIRRSGHVINNSVKQLLNTLVAVRSTAAYGNHLIGDSRLADAGLYLINGELLAAEILLEQLVVLFGDMLNELIMILLCKFLHVLGNILNSDVETLVIIVDISLHLNKVDDSLEVSFRAYGELNRNCVTLQALLHHVYNIIEVSSHNVHLVNIDHSRNLVLVRLSPDGFGLGLNAALCAKNGNRTVQNTQRTLNLNGEVHVAGSVDDVDSVVLPEAGSRSGGDCYTSLLLLLHPVHCRSTIMHFAEFVGLSCVEQDTLRCGGFACVNMRHDSDIPGLFQ